MTSSGRGVRLLGCTCRGRRWRASPCGGQQQRHRGRVKQDRNHQDEPAQHILVAGADQRREIPDRAQVGLRNVPVAVDLGLLDLQVGEDLRLDRKLVGKAVALGLPSLVVRGAEVGDRRGALGDGPN